VGSSIVFSHALNLIKDDKTLNLKYNKERKITYWYSFSKDTLFSIITGRAYRYDITNMNHALEFINTLKVTYNSVMFVMSFVLIRLTYVIKQYIGEFNDIDSSEKDFLKKKIKYWLKRLEPEYEYEYDIEKEELGNIIAFNELNIFFNTLKIIFYRRQSTSFVTSNSQNIPARVFNTPGGIGYNFTKYYIEERKYNRVLFVCCLNFIKEWKKQKNTKESKKEVLNYEGNFFFFFFFFYFFYYFLYKYNFFL